MLTSDDYRSRVKLVSIADVKEKQKLESAYSKARDSFMKSAPVTAVLQKFAALLQQQPSKAAVHRIIEKLDPGSYSNFVRNWTTAEQWIKARASWINVAKVAALVGEDTEDFASKIAHLDELGKKAKEPLPAIKTGIDYMQQF